MILKRMKRRYDASYVIERITKLRQRVSELVLSADVMVGFPTETEAHYLQTEQLLKQLNIAFPHVFSYSQRQGTPAARIPAEKQVPVAIRKQRNQRLRYVAAELKCRLFRAHVGQVVWGLPEKTVRPDGYTLVRSENYLPVLVKSEQLVAGKWQKIRYQTVKNDDLIGVVVSQKPESG